MMKRRRYPFNIQTFSRMRHEGYVYVDKTDVIWDMVHFSYYVFLSRPRRFGKSLLSKSSAAVYNPYSLFNAWADNDLQNYWFSTGTPRFLFRQMEHSRTDITALDNIEASATEFDLPTEGMTNALPLIIFFLTSSRENGNSLSFLGCKSFFLRKFAEKCELYGRKIL